MRRIILLSLCSASLMFAGIQPFSWPEVQPSDWLVQPPILDENPDAVILLEKTWVDDREDQLAIYRRIKIFNHKGYGWADVVIPHLHVGQELLELKGRTLLPDGRIFPLEKKRIFEQDVLQSGFKSKNIDIKRTAFSLSAIQDGCIIEYYAKLKTPLWGYLVELNETIPKLQHEVIWNQYYFLGLTGTYFPKIMFFNSAQFTPGFKCYHVPQPVIQKPDSNKELTSHALKFIFQQIPSFHEEPYSLNSQALQGQLKLYYSHQIENCTTELAGMVLGQSNELIKIHEQFDRQLAQFTQITDEREYIHHVYLWLQKNVKNIGMLEEQEVAPQRFPRSVDDILSRGYASSAEINILFYHFLKKHGIEVSLAMVADRAQTEVDPEICGWQFDEVIAMVRNRQGGYQTYSPGTPYLQPGQIPFGYEGTRTLVFDLSHAQWYSLPYSRAIENRQIRNLQLELSNEGALTAAFMEQSTGQLARSRRLLIGSVDSLESAALLKAQLQQLLPNAELDSIRFANLGDVEKPLEISCRVKPAPLLRQTGEKVFFQPTDYIDRIKNQFFAVKRKSPIQLEYAYDLIEVITMKLPDNWQIHALPRDSTFTSRVGIFAIRSMSFSQAFSIQKAIQVKASRWPTQDYAVVQDFFQKTQLMNNAMVVLTKHR